MDKVFVVLKYKDPGLEDILGVYNEDSLDDFICEIESDGFTRFDSNHWVSNDGKYIETHYIVEEHEVK